MSYKAVGSTSCEDTLNTKIINTKKEIDKKIAESGIAQFNALVLRVDSVVNKISTILLDIAQLKSNVKELENRAANIELTTSEILNAWHNG